MTTTTLDKVFASYDTIKRYNAVPTEQKSGRLHLNENLFKPSPKCMEVLSSLTYEDLFEYDLSKDDALEVELSKYLGLPIENVFVHNGSAEVIKTILSVVLNAGDTILLPTPNWSYYKSVADVKFAKTVYYDVVAGEDTYYHDVPGLLAQAEKHHPKVIVITTPHMPTGNIIAEGDLKTIAARNPASLILVDEAYLGFSDFEYDIKQLVAAYSNMVFTRTFSKFFGLANMRIGYCVCSPRAKSVLGLDLPLFRASVVSRNMAIAALRDREYYAAMKKEIIETREWFVRELSARGRGGIKPYRSYSNFVFIRLDGYDVQKMKNWMEENGIIVRLFVDKERLAMRITIAPRAIMERALHLFGEACKISAQQGEI